MAPSPPIVQTCLAPAQTYSEMVFYGRHKTHMKTWKLLVSALAGGIWIGVFGHCCTLGAGKTYNPLDPTSYGFASFLYAALFPGAFASIIYTGSDLFTSNTVAMTLNCVEDHFSPRSFAQLFRVWGCSFFGNYAGAALYAAIFSYLGGGFPDESAQWKFLCTLSEHKVHDEWLAIFVNAVGCNICVTVATWCAFFAKDVAGKFLCIWFPVAGFCVGGFQHVVANMYTLSAAGMMGCDVNAFDVIVKNILICALGNAVAGSFVTGAIWALIYSGQVTSDYDLTNQYNRIKEERELRLASSSSESSV
ncbi:MAG: hypothetical protein KVP17_003891 [Porospora cf. gigantea B]|uniref:uncharacterized protein n=1 Tax=Porospora cf. gigantea B TaxID=2853592 RepID=UPI003571BB5C|nr:MAG: hypothetical protein KVP17_003891 [Porospora cf. gigantea B]